MRIITGATHIHFQKLREDFHSPHTRLSLDVSTHVRINVCPGMSYLQCGKAFVTQSSWFMIRNNWNLQAHSFSLLCTISRTVELDTPNSNRADLRVLLCFAYALYVVLGHLSSFEPMSSEHTAPPHYWSVHLWVNLTEPMLKTGYDLISANHRTKPTFWWKEFTFFDLLKWN
jgi:hypothetical protein